MFSLINSFYARVLKGGVHFRPSFTILLHVFERYLALVLLCLVWGLVDSRYGSFRDKPDIQLLETGITIRSS